MSSLNTGISTAGQMDAGKSAWHKIRVQLEDKKARIYEEIGHYPTPIAGCDQQFNYLLEEQSRILRELARLNEAENKSLTAGDPIKMIDEFIQSSPYIDPEVA